MDIELKGTLNGIQLAEEIRKSSDLPIIYLSNLSSEAIVEKAAKTSPNTFLVKNKMSDINQILTTLKVALTQKPKPIIPKDTVVNTRLGVLGLVDYKENIKNIGMGNMNAISVSFDDILYFSLDDFENKKGKTEHIKDNYVWFLAKNQRETKLEYEIVQTHALQNVKRTLDYLRDPNQAQSGKQGVSSDFKIYFLETSIKKLAEELPYCFARINQYNIVNLTPNILKGRINGASLVIGNKKLKITHTFMEEVQHKLKKLYLEK
jgi:hypothetical protein